MDIAILGAPHSGRTWLARALAQKLPEVRVHDAPPLDATHGQRHTHTLVMGLDLPAFNDTVVNAAAQQQCDADLRALLQAHQIAYGVVYGQGEERLRNALRQLQPEPTRRPRWTSTCEKCSDPACEHRIFTELRRSMAAGPAPL